MKTRFISTTLILLSTLIGGCGSSDSSDQGQAAPQPGPAPAPPSAQPVDPGTLNNPNVGIQITSPGEYNLFSVNSYEGFLNAISPFIPPIVPQYQLYIISPGDRIELSRTTAKSSGSGSPKIYGSRTYYLLGSNNYDCASSSFFRTSYDLEVRVNGVTVAYLDKTDHFPGDEYLLDSLIVNQGGLVTISVPNSTCSHLENIRLSIVRD